MSSNQGERGRKVATIRATCPGCGDVDLTIPQVRAMVCATTNEGSYAFQCPTCSLAVSKPAEQGVVDLLVSAGVQLMVWEEPAELREPRNGPPITHDDLLAFHYELEQPDWLERLTAPRADAA